MHQPSGEGPYFFGELAAGLLFLACVFCLLVLAVFFGLLSPMAELLAGRRPVAR
jgi:hypothetical protein